MASNFKWEAQQPLPIRPFVNKKSFNPSMAIKNISDTSQDWLLIENTYYNNVRQRQKHIALEPEILTFIHNNNRTKQAVGEFYDMVTQFLLLRYQCILNMISGQELLPTLSPMINSPNIPNH